MHIQSLSSGSANTVTCCSSTPDKVWQSSARITPPKQALTLNHFILQCFNRGFATYTQSSAFIHFLIVLYIFFFFYLLWLLWCSYSVPMRFCIPLIYHCHTRTAPGQTASLQGEIKSRDNNNDWRSAASVNRNGNSESIILHRFKYAHVLLQASGAKHDRDTVWNEHGYSMHRWKPGLWSLSVLLAWLYLLYISATGCSL